MTENLGRDYLAKVKTNVGVFKPGGVYWCDTRFIGWDTEWRRRTGTPIDNGSSPTADTFPSSVIPQYVDQPKLLIVRGGIGDLLALSILCDLAPEVVVITQKELFHVLDWWEVTPTKKHFNEPLFTVKYPKKERDYLKDYGQQVGDHAIAQGSRENWYEIISKSVKKPLISGRPRLKKRLPDGVNRLQKGSVLVVHKATSDNRSAELQAILGAIPAQKPVFWYDSDRRLNGEGPKTTIQQYLSDLYHADFVISVDTSAIHFREGIGKPALGLYTSFSAESRTKYYQYTRSIDVPSPCGAQPCFMNFTPCPIIQKGCKYPPCLSSDNPYFIETIQKQLHDIP